MARIRSIKPEFWQDEKLSPCPPVVRLVFLGLISQADDAGRMVDNPKLLDGLLFPHTEDTSAGSIEDLARLGRVLRYTTDSGQRLLQIVNWDEHQRVVNPSKYNLPEPTPDDIAQIPAPQQVADYLKTISGASIEVRNRVSLESKLPIPDPISSTMDRTTEPGSDEPGAAAPLADEAPPPDSAAPEPDDMSAWTPKRRFMARWMPLARQAWAAQGPPEGAAATYERNHSKPLTLDTEGSIGWQWSRDFEDDTYDGAELAIVVATLAVERADGEPFSFTSFHSRKGRERLNEMLAEAQKRCPTKAEGTMGGTDALAEAERFIEEAKRRQGRAA